MRKYKFIGTDGNGGFYWGRNKRGVYLYGWSFSWWNTQ